MINFNSTLWGNKFIIGPSKVIATSRATKVTLHVPENFSSGQCGAEWRVRERGT
jgi:hypothetical protein